MTWPTFGDDDQDVEKFLEDFDEMISMGNDGRGLESAERLRLLGSCFHGTRKQAFEVIRDEAKRKRIDVEGVGSDTEWKLKPQEVYDKVVQELQFFKETAMERKTRVDNAWDALTRGKRTARQFLQLFRTTLANLEKPPRASRTTSWGTFAKSVIRGAGRS